MKMEYRRHLDNGAAPWQLVTNIDELMWNGEYFIRVSNDDGSSQLPFPLNNDETATLVVKDYSHEGKLQRNRKIVQEISKVERDGGKVLNYSRVYHEIYGRNQWGSWEQETNREGTSTDDNKEENKILWTSSSYLDTYTTAGIYDITGERTNAADGLPFANAAPGHTFHARLLVLDSSIAGSGKDTDKCITQILSLSNRTGGDGNVYTRTGRAASTNALAGGNGWEPWGKLQQNIEVGQVTSLDSFTDNGIYSGVYTGGDNHVENFVMVVINNYAVAQPSGNVRSISQYKHALNIDGTFSQMVRTGQGNTGISWGAWTDFSAAGIQDGAITAQKLSADVRENVNSIPGIIESASKEKSALVNGDTIVGLAREVYSRQGKNDQSAFVIRTAAGSTSICDGVATLKQIGGNIVKNLVHGTFEEGTTYDLEMSNVALYDGIMTVTTKGNAYGAVRYFYKTGIDNHVYYTCASVFNTDAERIIISVNGGNETTSFSETRKWSFISARGVNKYTPATAMATIRLVTPDQSPHTMYVKNWFVVDLTEMYGTGNEPTKDECDKIYSTMDALPRGLTVANPTEFKSFGYNQWNPANLFTGKTIVDNAIVDGDNSIAVIECLPCKVGAGENNGYVIGYGEGDTWNDAGIDVYLSPLNPMTTDGELYMHKLEKDAALGTYIPGIKGYLLVVTPSINKLCAHFYWSGDRAITDYEPYFVSSVALPIISEMNEWGLAGVNSAGKSVCDTIDFENNKYIKRIGKVDMGDLQWNRYTAITEGNVFYVRIQEQNIAMSLVQDVYTTVSYPGSMDYNKIRDCTLFSHPTLSTIYLRDDSKSDVATLKSSLSGKTLYYELAIPEEYPIVAKTAPNYITSDYGIELFEGASIPLAANILFYMRSLVSETRNFLDRLMAGLGTSDATVVADMIVAAITASGDEEAGV